MNIHHIDGIRLRQLLWRFTAWLIWHQSEALRNDYLDKQDQAWAQGMTMMDRAEWIGRRTFGDRGGYRYD